MPVSLSALPPPRPHHGDGHDNFRAAATSGTDGPSAASWTAAKVADALDFTAYSKVGRVPKLVSREPTVAGALGQGLRHTAVRMLTALAVPAPRPEVDNF